MLGSFCSSILYLEGNLETKIFADPITGLVRRIREVAIRRNGTFITPLHSLNVETSHRKKKSTVTYVTWYNVSFIDL